jgi:hypothetical protein
MFGWLRRAPIAPTEEQLRVTQALVDYPPYAPPEWNPDPEFQRDANVAYQEYFFASRQARLDALRDFFAKFDVALNLEDAGIMAVSTWLPQYADLLVDFDDDAVRDAYRELTAPWIGELTGLNPIFDLSIYYAECVWLRRTKLNWLVYRDPQRGGSTHFISGLPRGGKLFDTFNYMYLKCAGIRGGKRLRVLRGNLRADSFTVQCSPTLRPAAEVERDSRTAVIM